MTNQRVLTMQDQANIRAYVQASKARRGAELRCARLARRVGWGLMLGTEVHTARRKAREAAASALDRLTGVA